MRDATVRIARGGTALAASRARRLDPPRNDRWEVAVAPGGKEDVTVSVGPFASCSEAGAVCAAGGEVLANAVTKTILGPPGLSVADARVHEAPGATVAFAVTLGRASRSRVPHAMPAGTPFRVRLEVPDEHDGTGEIAFGVSFNREPAAGYSYRGAGRRRG